MKAMIREFIRSLKHNLARFLSIVAIIALGVGFFAGINATKPDMIKSGAKYYADYKLMDLRAMNPLGYRPEDIARLKEIPGIQTLQPSYTKDLFMTKGDAELTVKLYSLDVTSYGDNTINQLLLKEGRLPEKSGEIVLAQGKYTDIDIAMGDVVRFRADDGGALSEILRDQMYTVVGFVESPLYITVEREHTNIGSGSIATYVYVPEEDFTMEKPSEFFFQVAGSAALSPETGGYKDLILPVRDRVEALGKEIMGAQTAELKSELQENRDKLTEERTKAEKKLADARAELDQAERDLIEGETTLIKEEADGRKEIQDGREELMKAREQLLAGRLKYNEGYLKWSKGNTEYLAGKAKLDEAAAELAQGKAELDAAKLQLDQGNAMLKQNEATLESSRQQIETFGDIVAGLNEVLGTIPDTPSLSEEEYAELLDAMEKVSPETAEYVRLYIPFSTPEAPAAIRSFLNTSLDQINDSYDSAKSAFDAGQAQYDQAKKDLAKGQKKYDQGLKEYKKGKAELDKAKAEAAQGKKELDDGKDTLDESKKKLDDAEIRITQGELKLDKGLEELETGVKDGRAKLEEGRQELQEGREKFAMEETNALKKLREADDEILDAERKILDIPDHWFVGTRDANPGYSSWFDNADKIGQVAMVFPAFFFLVAALVSLTTITRMVEEERTQSGTLKALGYTNGWIAGKYIAYALLASLLGSLLGLLLGFNVFPRIIIWAYQMMYNIPASVIEFNLTYALVSILVAALSAVGAAAAAVFSEIRERPAALMQPKAPPKGRTILLERITPLWSRLSFSRKVAFRNLFRYKKRFWMTVLGISGCTALILTGFGIKDSVDAIVANQFRELFIYDQLITTDSNRPPAQRDLAKLLEDRDDVDSYAAAQMLNMKVHVPGSDRTYDSTLVVPEKPGRLSAYIVLRNRVSQEPLPLTDSGVIISEKLAELTDVAVGDRISYEDSEKRQFSAVISGIAENYMSNYIYISPAYYETVHVMKPDFNTAWLQLTEDALANEEATRSSFMESDSIIAVISSSEISKTFDEQMASLNYVVVVLIISAAALAFIVLYNLSNVNITERIRELATIKVLGFHDREVSAYVNRENSFLTIFGALFGLAMGMILHRFIISTMEIDNMMFGKIIQFPSYLYSLLLTFLFSALVSFISHFALRKIDMVESLKSLE